MRSVAASGCLCMPLSFTTEGYLSKNAEQNKNHHHCSGECSIDLSFGTPDLFLSLSFDDLLGLFFLNAGTSFAIALFIRFVAI